EKEKEDQQKFSLTQCLKTAVHNTTGSVCQEAASDKEIEFSKQTMIVTSEVIFQQCESFAKDLEIFARSAKKE
uniref:Centromere protein S n=1 Tax=Sarcophilus harrisii TaxID=9305 RepID=A0A7N4UXH9_SARHA